MRNVCEVLGRFGKRISVGVFHVCIFFKKKKWEKRRKRKRKKKIIIEENKKFKFQFKGVVGGVRRIVGELEFL